MTLTLENLQKSYGPLTVLNRCSFSFADGRIYCLMAPSGSGKTTLFRILMGLEQADGGAVRSDLPSPRFSAVFQEDRLCETFSPVEICGWSWEKASPGRTSAGSSPCCCRRNLSPAQSLP